MPSSQCPPMASTETGAPQVSILMPCLNAVRFLPDCLASVLTQTRSDWELLVGDSGSTDGSLDLLCEAARSDARINVHTLPREGVYAAWNRLIARAQAPFILLLPADDWLHPDFLERMLAGLKAETGCDLAHCSLLIADETGSPHGERTPWAEFYGSLYFMDWLPRSHVRLAPHDGILYAGVRTLYTSLTQLLIRRRLFQRIGHFRTDLGSFADFEWGMRAGLVADTVHVPGVTAYWRVHGQQQTLSSDLDTAVFYRRLAEMVRLALKAAVQVSPDLRRLKMRELTRHYRRERINILVKGSRGSLATWFMLLRLMLANPDLAPAIWRWRFEGNPSLVAPMEPLDFVRDLVRRYGLGGCLVPAKGPELSGPGSDAGNSIPTEPRC